MVDLWAAADTLLFGGYAPGGAPPAHEAVADLVFGNPVAQGPVSDFLAWSGGASLTADIADAVDPGGGYALQLDADRRIAGVEADLKTDNDGTPTLGNFLAGFGRVIRGDVGEVNTYTQRRNATWDEAWSDTADDLTPDFDFGIDPKLLLLGLAALALAGGGESRGQS